MALSIINEARGRRVAGMRNMNNNGDNYHNIAVYREYGRVAAVKRRRPPRNRMYVC